MEKIIEKYKFPEEYKNKIYGIQKIYDLLSSVTPYNVDEVTEELLQHLNTFNYQKKYQIFYDAFNSTHASHEYILPYTSTMVYKVVSASFEQNWDKNIRDNEPEDIYGALILYSELVIAYIIRNGFLPYQTFLLLLIAKFHSNPYKYAACFLIIGSVVPPNRLKEAYAEAINFDFEPLIPKETFNKLVDTNFIELIPYVDYAHSNPVDLITAVLHDDLDFYLSCEKTDRNKIDIVVYPLVTNEITMAINCHARKIALHMLEKMSEKELSACANDIIGIINDVEIVSYLSKRITFYPSYYMDLLQSNETQITEWCIPFLNGNIEKYFNERSFSPYSYLAYACAVGYCFPMYRPMNCKVFSGIRLLTSFLTFQPEIINDCYLEQEIDVIEAYVRSRAKLYGILPFFNQLPCSSYVSHYIDLVFSCVDVITDDEYKAIIKRCFINEPHMIACLGKHIPVRIINSYKFNGLNLLYRAASTNNVSNFNALASIPGIDVNNNENEGRAAPIHIAAFNGSYMIVKILVDTKRCDLNKKDVFGRTALGYTKDPEIAKLLYANGARLCENDFDDSLITSAFNLYKSFNDNKTETMIAYKMIKMSSLTRESHRFLNSYLSNNLNPKSFSRGYTSYKKPPREWSLIDDDSYSDSN